jgi:hypothetical protein
MIDLVDKIVLTVLDTGWTSTPPPAKPTFAFTVPDEDWKNQAAAPGVRLNIYLYEVRENREMRRASWTTVEQADQTVVRSAPPAQVECHYLISAWSRLKNPDALSPEQEEHQVLAEALRVILRNPDVNPAALGIAGGGPIFRDAHVQLSFAPPESPRVLNDFWSTMKLPWRPAIPLVATAPLDLRQSTTPGPLVTTVIQRYGLSDVPGGGQDEWVQVGGWVLRNSDGSPIPGARVVRKATGDQVLTDAQGHYTFAGLRRGPVGLRVSAVGFTPIDRTLNIPVGPLDDQIFRLS